MSTVISSTGKRVQRAAANARRSVASAAPSSIADKPAARSRTLAPRPSKAEKLEGGSSAGSGEAAQKRPKRGAQSVEDVDRKLAFLPLDTVCGDCGAEFQKVGVLCCVF